MKFVISSSELLRGILSVSKAVPAKTTTPILGNFLFVLEGNTLEITASDTELTLKTAVETESTEEEGQIAVPAATITDLLKALPDLPLKIVTTGDSTFECDWQSGKSSLPYFPAADFPELPGMDETAVTVTYDAQSLVEAINGTIYATADDEMRPTMNGILFDIENDLTTLVASDSHKLICYTIRDAKSAVISSFILHKKPAGILRSIIDKGEETVEVTFDTKNVSFRFGSTLAFCRLIAGKYPKYREVIPKNNSNVLKIDRERLLNTVRRISVCSNKGSNQVKFDLKSGCLEISAQDLGFSKAAYEKIDCQYDGEEISIGFKSTFLAEILSNMDCGDLVIKFADGKRAALIIPAEDEEESGKVCGILMPIMV